MDVVAARDVPVYFELEEEIISAPSKVVRGPCLTLLHLTAAPISVHICHYSR